MKNFELFPSVSALKAAWSKREEITKGQDEERRYLPESILDWACFWDADTALDPKLKPGTLVELTGINLEHYPEGSLGIVVRPVMGYLNQPITGLMVRMTDGKDAKIDSKYLRPSSLPDGVLQLARNQLIEEARAKCPLCKEC